MVSLDKSLEVNHISARVGDNVEIKCDVTGTPPPPLVWRRYGTDVETLSEPEVFYSNEIIRSLSFAVSPIDVIPVYRIHLSNKYKKYVFLYLLFVTINNLLVEKNFISSIFHYILLRMGIEIKILDYCSLLSNSLKN